MSARGAARVTGPTAHLRSGFRIKETRVPKTTWDRTRLPVRLKAALKVHEAWATRGPKKPSCSESRSTAFCPDALIDCVCSNASRAGSRPLHAGEPLSLGSSKRRYTKTKRAANMSSRSSGGASERCMSLPTDC